MAGSFDRSTANYLHGAVPASFVGSPPLSFGCWFRPGNVTADQVIMSFSNDLTDLNYYQLYLKGSTAGDPIAARSQTVSGGSEAVTTTGVTVNTWHHALAVFAASNDRRVYIDGGSKGTQATSRVTAGPNKIAVGAVADATPSDFISAAIEWAAAWNVALIDADALSLARGVNPRKIRPQNLIWYCPLRRGKLTHELVSGVSLTNVNSVADSSVRSPGRDVHVAGSPLKFGPPASASASWRLTDSLLLNSKALHSKLRA